ncbi:MAG: hypothetical protein ACREJC_10895, partial [Tepidisphaeraceae bacterium]
AVPSAVIEGPYSTRIVTAFKVQMLRRYDDQIAGARMALRRKQISATEVRDLVEEQAALQRLPLDRLRELMMEADVRNARRVERYRESFAQIEDASRTVVTILMKSALIESATPLPDDPLSEELEQARGVRRVYYQFILPTREGSPRRHNGYVEFSRSTTKGLWVPTWADIDGDPIPLFDSEAFVPLRPYRILFDGIAFIVIQDPIVEAPTLFALIGPRLAAIPPNAIAGARR